MSVPLLQSRNLSDLVVIVRLTGGIGNQLFQYAAGRALSLRTGLKLKLDRTWYETQSFRKYELDQFCIQEEFATSEEIGMYAGCARDYPRGLFGRLTARLAPLPRARLFQEHVAGFDTELVNWRGPAYLDGYWQSEDYFADVSETIRADLAPRRNASPVAEDWASRIHSVPHPVSVHIRRGDYVSNPALRDVHGVCPTEYYNLAVQHIATVVGQPLTLFVFSDDPEWISVNFTSRHECHNVSASCTSAVDDLMLMAACRHHVVANSSFSWWGAWLSSVELGVVVCPRTWFIAQQIDSSKVVPVRWIRL